MGMNCTTEIVVDSSTDTLIIPVETVNARKGKYSVTMEDGTQREVEIGIYDENNIEIVSGLTEGEKVKLPAKVVSDATNNKENKNSAAGFMGGSSMPIGNNPFSMGGGMNGGNMGGNMNGGRQGMRQGGM